MVRESLLERRAGDRIADVGWRKAGNRPFADVSHESAPGATRMPSDDDAAGRDECTLEVESRKDGYFAGRWATTSAEARRR